MTAVEGPSGAEVRGGARRSGGRRPRSPSGLTKVAAPPEGWKRKVAVGPDKRSWHPSPLLGQLVLVTTLNGDGTSNVAPKNWISYMAFDPSIIALGCSLRHRTARNILRSKEFVVNVPGEDLADAVWAIGGLEHPRPVESTGLTPIPSARVGPPRIEECRAHVECVLDRKVLYGDEVVLLARVVAASVDREALGRDDPYEYLRMLVFLEDGTYGTVRGARRVKGGGPAAALTRPLASSGPSRSARCRARDPRGPGASRS